MGKPDRRYYRDSQRDPQPDLGQGEAVGEKTEWRASCDLTHTGSGANLKGEASGQRGGWEIQAGKGRKGQGGWERGLCVFEGESKGTDLQNHRCDFSFYKNLRETHSCSEAPSPSLPPHSSRRRSRSPFFLEEESVLGSLSPSSASSQSHLGLCCCGTAFLITGLGFPRRAEGHAQDSFCCFMSQAPFLVSL